MTLPSNIKTLLGTNLREIREIKGLTQEELAEQIGISHAPISKIENGEGNPTLDTIEKITDALGITPMELFDFGRIKNIENNLKLEELIITHRNVLINRSLSEVQYVVEATNRFLNVIDNKK